VRQFLHAEVADDQQRHHRELRKVGDYDFHVQVAIARGERATETWMAMKFGLDEGSAVQRPRAPRSSNRHRFDA